MDKPERQHARLGEALRMVNNWKPLLTPRSMHFSRIAVSAAFGLEAEGCIWVAPGGPFPPVRDKLTLLLDAGPLVEELGNIRRLSCGAVFREYYRDMRERFVAHPRIIDLLSPGQREWFSLEDPVLLNAILEDQILSAFCVHKVNYQKMQTVRLFADLLELWIEGNFPIGLYAIASKQYLVIIHGSVTDDLYP